MVFFGFKNDIVSEVVTISFLLGVDVMFREDSPHLGKDSAENANKKNSFDIRNLQIICFSSIHLGMR